jgi:hypothetical protein
MDIVYSHISAEGGRVLACQAFVKIPGMLVVLRTRDPASGRLASANLVASGEAKLVALPVGYGVLTCAYLATVFSLIRYELST